MASERSSSALLETVRSSHFLSPSKYILFALYWQYGFDSGAVYLLFPRRRRFHPPTFDTVRFALIVFFPTFFCFSLLCYGIGYFFWRYRRLPDPIEKMVLESGLEIGKGRGKKVYVSTVPIEERCHEYYE